MEGKKKKRQKSSSSAGRANALVDEDDLYLEGEGSCAAGNESDQEKMS